MLRLVAAITVMTMVAVWVAYILTTIISLPVAAISYESGKCVYVESEDDSITCESLPRKYRHYYIP